MSWLFGKKKPAPEVFISNETVEGFSVISPVAPAPYPPPGPQQRVPYPLSSGSVISSQPAYPVIPQAPYPITPTSFPAPYPSQPFAAPYPSQPSITPYPTRPISTPHQPSGQPKTTNVSNPLDSVPFTLTTPISKKLSLVESEFDFIKKKVDDLKVKLSSESYGYDFQLEHSVIRECSSISP